MRDYPFAAYLSKRYVALNTEKGNYEFATYEYDKVFADSCSAIDIQNLTHFHIMMASNMVQMTTWATKKLYDLSDPTFKETESEK